LVLQNYSPVSTTTPVACTVTADPLVTDGPAASPLLSTVNVVLKPAIDEGAASAHIMRASMGARAGPLGRATALQTAARPCSGSMRTSESIAVARKSNIAEIESSVFTETREKI
jgi:hypothetical protein